MSLRQCQEKFYELMREFKTEKERTDFLKWIRSNWDLVNLNRGDDGDDDDDDDRCAQDVLNAIAAELRPLVPLSAVLPSETITLPSCGPNSDCQSQTTQHLDEFLYDDEYIDDLVDKGELSRHYCNKCLSRDVKPLTLISHSMSVNRVRYLFRCLLPPLKSETVLDVGSRLGPVLYGAHVYTTCPTIVGVEMNREFCDLQERIVKKYKFQDRIRVVCNNVFNEMDLLSSADVVVLNNVFEFFTDADTALTSWHLIAQNVKPGAILVTIPHLDRTFEHVKVRFDWRDWVEELTPYKGSAFPGETAAGDYNDGGDDDSDNHADHIKHYRVKKRMTT